MISYGSPYLPRDVSLALGLCKLLLIPVRTLISSTFFDTEFLQNRDGNHECSLREDTLWSIVIRYTSCCILTLAYRTLLLLLLSLFSRVRLCATPQTTAHQAPPSLGFSRQEHWSGLPFPSPMHESEKGKGSRSSQPHGPQPTRLLCPWDFPGKSTGVGRLCLLRREY